MKKFDSKKQDKKQIPQKKAQAAPLQKKDSEINEKSLKDIYGGAGGRSAG